MIRACQLCKYLPLVVALLLTGCGGGGGVEGDDRQEPTPPPDSTQRTGTGFEAEAEGITPDADGSFSLGERPISAKFSGGNLKQTRLAHTGDWAWTIDEGGMATIDFTTPLSEMVLWFTNESVSEITVVPDPDSNAKPVCGIDDQGNDNSE